MRETIEQEGRIPPQCIDVESAVLGAMLLDKEAIDNVVGVLTDECFYKPAHQVIFHAIVGLYQKNEPVDLITVTQALKESGELLKIGGEYFLTELSNKVSSAANAEYHAHIVLEHAIRRQLIHSSSEIINEAYSDTTDALSLLDKAGAFVYKIAEKTLTKAIASMSSAVQTFTNWFDNVTAINGVTGIPSGYIDIDRITCGFQPANLIIIAGTSSSGKTSLALSIARNAAMIHGHSVGIFSLEMPTRDIVLRLLSAETKINSTKILGKQLWGDEPKRIIDALKKFHSSKIYIDDTASLSILDFRSKSRKMKHEFSISLIIVDFLQLMQGSKDAGNRDQEIGSISRTLKAVSKELNIPVIALSQLNRGIAESKDKKPQLWHLRESGNIEQDADVVMFVYRPEIYGITQYDDMPTEGMAEIIIAKNRNGETKSVKLQFIKQYARFENHSTAVMTEPDTNRIIGEHKEEETQTSFLSENKPEQSPLPESPF
jgi:replicative DNA helicase